MAAEGFGGGLGLGMTLADETSPLSLASSPWHHAMPPPAAYPSGGGGGGSLAFHRRLAETTRSSSIYHQPEGGILSGHGVLDDTLSLFMVQTVIIITVTRILSLGTKFLKQPRVIMEVVGGILLGPSALGHIPGYLDTVFPKDSLGYLALVANLGLVLYLFLVGVELDPEVLQRNGRKAITIAAVGIALPFGLGCLIAPLLFHKLLIVEPGYENAHYGSFLVFVGSAMSITAFPVLARILTESKLILSTAGVMTMGAAALNDAIAWCLLVLALSIVHAGDNKLNALYVFLCIVAYAIGLFLIVRPALGVVVKWVEMTGSVSLRSLLFALLICCIFLSSWITAFLGVHAIFGSFLVGMIMPRDCKFTLHMCEKIDDLVSSIFLPLYFALSGLKTDVGSISHAIGGGMLVLVVLMATAGKFIGCAGTARINGIPLRESAVIGILMNTRGLVELIVLNLGLQAKILDVEIFTIMVMMALITTIMTSPIVEYIYPPDLRAIASMDALRAAGAVHTPGGSNLEESMLTEALSREAAGEGGAMTPATGGKGQNGDVEMAAKSAAPGVGTPGGVGGKSLPGRLLSGGGVGGSGGVGKRMAAALSLRRFRLEPSADRLRESLLLSRTWRVGVAIERMKDLPETMAILYLFAPIYSNNSQMDVTAMHFVETELTSTDVMIAAHPEKASAMDPALLAINHFCRAVGAQIHCRTIYGNPHDFASDLVAIERRAGLDIVLMPWRRPVAYLGDYYDRFLSKTLKHSTITVALMVPDPSGKTDMVRQVLVVLSGCPSDADCVALASRFALHSLVSITLMLMPAAQEQSGKYADFLKDFGPGGRFTNVRLLRLEPYDAELQPRSVKSLMKDILEEASRKGDNAYDLIVVGYSKGSGTGRDTRASSAQSSSSHWLPSKQQGTGTGTGAAPSVMDSAASSANPSRAASPPLGDRKSSVASTAATANTTGSTSSLVAPTPQAAAAATTAATQAASSSYQQMNSASVGRGSKPPRIPLPHLLLRPQSPALPSDGSGGKGHQHPHHAAPPVAAQSPTAAMLGRVADKVQRFGEGVRHSALTRNFSGTRLKDKDKDKDRESMGGETVDGSEHAEREKDPSRQERSSTSSYYWGHRSSFKDKEHRDSLSSASAGSERGVKSIPEFGLIGERIYAAKTEAFLMVVRGYQPDEVIPSRPKNPGPAAAAAAAAVGKRPALVPASAATLPASSPTTTTSSTTAAAATTATAASAMPPPLLILAATNSTAAAAAASAGAADPLRVSRSQSSDPPSSASLAKEDEEEEEDEAAPSVAVPRTREVEAGFVHVSAKGSKTLNPSSAAAAGLLVLPPPPKPQSRIESHTSPMATAGPAPSPQNLPTPLLSDKTFEPPTPPSSGGGMHKAVAAKGDVVLRQLSGGTAASSGSSAPGSGGGIGGAGQAGDSSSGGQANNGGVA